MLKLLLLLLFCSQWLNRWLERISGDKEVMRKSDILGESSDLTLLHLLERVFKHRECPTLDAQSYS